MHVPFRLTPNEARRILIVGGTRKRIPAEFGACHHVDGDTNRVVVPNGVHYVILWASRASHTQEYALKSQVTGYRVVRGGAHSLLLELARIRHAEGK